MKIPSLNSRNIYWDERFKEGLIYGTKPSKVVRLIVPYIKSSSRILIIGGGYGRNAAYLAKHGFNVLNTDVSKKAINLGRKIYKNVKNLRFEIEDVFNLKIKKESFDAVIAIYYLSLFTSDEVDKIFKNIREIIKNDGKFCANFLSLDDEEYGHGKEIKPNTFLYEDGQLVKFYTKEEIRNLFKKHKFKIDKIIK